MVELSSRFLLARSSIMLNELISLTRKSYSLFKDTVRDSFGYSIINDVYEPIMNEIKSLQRLDDHFRQKANEINRLLEQTKSIKPNGGTLI